ncbi:zinc finger matrin-type protein CG9776-like isoform X2 [Coccinella septempunctata]|uniref:zinc finger matrin-type protein CG9776-like isoform X2 n=1 Tax=Coccinella septempunctata TaxID=41139 RepID=UPI001D05DDE0|nr:zinc finger matrin-type protein CG9776-like isoform X2 [Coccinella septempunctata]
MSGDKDEIQTKMKAIKNVIEMLSSIIKDGLSITDLQNQLREDSPAKKPSKSPPFTKETHTQFNYVHYDPELHWCRMCDKFPRTAKEFLVHLQSKKHQENIEDNDVGDSTPWHKLPAEPELPQYEGAPKKRIPIKGLQFFISAPSWYCKLCDVWIGDLHCASQHLKSQVHFQNYQNFVEQNPHWEMEWLKDREKALSRTDKRGSDSDDSDSDAKRKKKKKDKKSFDVAGAKDKKKKRKSKKHKRRSSASSSSSSSSESSSENEGEDKSRSIRVAMRNVKAESILQEDLTGKWEMLGRLMEEHKRKAQLEEKVEPKKEPANDNLINQWMTINEPPEKEKYLLDSLKDRMKQKHSLEQAKYVELEKRQKEREQREREELEKKQREEKEAFEQRERERKEQERLEFERILDKDRSQVKFKQSFREKQNYRRKSPSPSPEHHHGTNKSSNRDREREYERSKRERTERERSDRERTERISDSPKKRAASPRMSPPNPKYKRHSRGSNSHSRSRSRSRGPEPRRTQKEPPKPVDKKPPGPPSYKKLPFIGRMPLFKNKKPEEKAEKEIQKEEYDKPRQTRFEPGNLPRAFIPDPDVVCFPKLSSYPELAPPPPAPLKPPPPAPRITKKPVKAPPPPKIEEPKPAPPPKEIVQIQEPFKNEDFDPSLYEEPSQLWQNSDNGYGMYPPMYPPDTVPISHMMPLQPPPLPPGDDDLALLGISADDMAAQSF